MTVAHVYAEMLEALEDLLTRFTKVCPDADGNPDPADATRIRRVEDVIKKAKETAELPTEIDGGTF